MLKKENLIKNLKNNCFCRIGLSKIHGVGVLAVKDIPKDSKIFELCNHEFDEDIFDLKESELKELDEGVIEYLKSFMIKNQDGYPVPEKGLNFINISFFLNHSDTPNVIHSINIINNKVGYLVAVAARDIKKGEELTEDYYSMGVKEDVENQFPFLKKQAGVV